MSMFNGVVRRFGPWVLFVAFVSLSLADEPKFSPIDLQPNANHKLGDSFHEAVQGK